MQLADCMAADEELAAQRSRVATYRTRLREVEERIENPVFAEMQIWETVRDHIGGSLSLAGEVDTILADSLQHLERASVPALLATKGHGAAKAKRMLKHAINMRDCVRDAIVSSKAAAATERGSLDRAHQDFLEELSAGKGALSGSDCLRGRSRGS